jgi:diguanylate cyclase (GGDEF)-like protein
MASNGSTIASVILFGDQVLKLVGKALQRELRLSDFVARIGGDEFVVVLRELRSEGAVSTLTQRLATLIQELKLPEGVDGNLGASFGLAAFPQDGRRMIDLLLAADQRMYADKLSRKRLYILPRPRTEESDAAIGEPASAGQTGGSIAASGR